MGGRKNDEEEWAVLIEFGHDLTEGCEAPSKKPRSHAEENHRLCYAIAGANASCTCNGTVPSACASNRRMSSLPHVMHGLNRSIISVSHGVI